METFETCSRCGSHRPPSIKSFTSEADEIAYLNQELASLDQEMLELQRKKAQVFCRMNELQSNTRKLPPETLSEIFKYVPFIPRDIVRILSVSSLWSRTARSTPEVWAELSLFVEPGKEEKSRNILQLCLSNVGTLPFALHVLRAGWEGEPLLQASCIKGHEEKIRRLEIMNPLPSETCMITNFHQLEELKLEVSIWELMVIDLKNQVRLQNLTLSFSDHTLCHIISATNLTTLTINNYLSVSFFLKILSQCQHTLTKLELTVWNIVFPEQHLQPLTLSCLQILRVRWVRSLPTLLHCLRFPALESLVLKISSDPEEIDHIKYLDWPGLWTKLPIVPVTLAIENPGAQLKYFATLVYALEDLHEVRELHVTFPDHTTNVYLNKLLKSLSTNSERNPLLPHIHRLMIQDTIDPGKWFNSLIRMIKTRKPGLKEDFNVELQLQNLSEVHREQLEGVVTQLRGEGYLISIDIHG